MKSFSEYVADAKTTATEQEDKNVTEVGPEVTGEELSEGLIYKKTFAIAAKKAGDDFKALDALIKDPKVVEKAINDVGKALGAKVHSATTKDKAVYTIGNNSSITVTNANYGDHVELRLFVKGGIDDEGLKALAKLLKSLNLF